MCSNCEGALRTLLRKPLVAAVAVISLAFGIGANIAIFSVFYQALLRPLPGGATGPTGESAVARAQTWSNFDRWRQQSRGPVYVSDVPGSRARAVRFYRHRCTPALRRQPRIQQRRWPAPGCSCRGATSPCSASGPRSDGCSGRMTIEGVARIKSSCCVHGSGVGSSVRTRRCSMNRSS